MEPVVSRIVTEKGIDFTVEYVDDGDDFIDFEVFAEIKNTTKVEWVNVTEIIKEELLEEMADGWEERGTE